METGNNYDHNESIAISNTKEAISGEKAIHPLEKIVINYNKVLIFIAGICVTAIMLLVVGNAIIRTFASPFSGTTEVVGWLAAVAIAFALGYTQIERGHVDIDLLVNKFPPIIKRILQSIVLFISILFFALLGWRLLLYGNSVLASGRLSPTLEIIYYPLIYLVGFGFLGLTLTLIVDFIKVLKRGEM